MTPIKGVFLLALLILSTHFFYYPKWKLGRSEATISWDVSGYYLYLPATFIYKDLKNLDFYNDVRDKYNFTPDFQQAYLHRESGNYVMKYSMGQAIHLAPFFFCAHLYAINSEIYQADGYSLPYQFMISMGALLIAILGLFTCFYNLREYFSEWTSFTALTALLLGSNYLNYTAIDGAMTHNTLFTLYALLIFTVIRFYKSPSFFKATLIGLITGLAALTRPTEILSIILPVLWGVNVFNWDSLVSRIQLLLDHKRKILLAIMVCLSVGCLQLIYWKYISGEWLVYSYGEEGFSWLRPHLHCGLLSYKSGWLVYSPLMIFSLFGFYSLYKLKRNLFSATFIFSILFIYIAFAWDIWWYGGSLGQRTMVQAYPILLFPLAAFFQKLWTVKRILRIVIAGIIMTFIYFSLWFTHQAHRGGLLHAGFMTKAYFWKTLGTYQRDLDDTKLLDTDEYFDGDRVVLEENVMTNQIINLSDTVQFSQPYRYEPKVDFQWARIAADFSIRQKEWDIWRMTQMTVSFKNTDNIVKQRFIRIQRHLNDGQSKRLFIDVEAPSEPFTSIEVYFYNAEGNKSIQINNVVLELYNEEY